jgi:hypothetical protein
MSKVINPGSKVEIVGGLLDGTRGVLRIGKFPMNENYRGIIVVESDDGKSYPMGRTLFRELKKIT